MVVASGALLVRLVEALHADFGRLEHLVFDGTKPYNLNHVGIRGTAVTADLFDDFGLTVWRDEHRAWQGLVYRITTDPGKPWLASPMREEGCAVLCPGQLRGAYRRGLHKGRPALVATRTLPVWRDADRDLELDPVVAWRKHLANPGSVPQPTVYQGTAVNYHDRGGARGTLVGAGSAGCQVTEADATLARILELVARQERNGAGWDLVTYTLVDAMQASDLASVAGDILAA